MMDSPRVSVVTPFYNTVQYLETAIKSVLSQSFQDFEYILSDNCSTDGSLEVAQHYAALDRRVRVYSHAEFVPQIPNYNRALTYIDPRSQFCKIVQADDWIYQDCLREMVQLAQAHPKMVIVSCCYLAGDAIFGAGLPFDRNVFSGTEACRTRLLAEGTYFGSPTNVMYRADVVRRTSSFFDENENISDTIACFQLLADDAEFGRVPQILAYLRRGNVSIWGRERAMGTAAFNNYALVERFGPRYLSAEEFKARRSTLEDDYLRMLARAWVGRADPSYWEFHARCMAKLGRTLPRGRIALRVADYVLDKLGNPRRSMELIFNRLRELRRPSDD